MIARDDSVVATNHIDAAAARRTVQKRAIADFKMIEAGEFEQVVVTRSGHIAEGAFFKNNMVGRRIVGAAVVGVHAVAGLVLKN